VFVFKPKSGKAAPNETVRVRLDNVPLSTKMGITNVEIRVKKTSLAPAVRTTHPLGKFPYHFKLTDFHADDPFIQRGESTNIRWTVSGDSKVQYEFYINGTNSGKPSSEIKSPLKTGSLLSTTVYKLTAKYQVAQQTLRHDTSTTVFVNNGDVTTDRLTAKTATIAGLIPACVKTLVHLDNALLTDDYLRWTVNNWGDVSEGLLIATLKIDQDESKSAKLTLTIESADADRQSIQVISGSNQGRGVKSFILPMPAGERFWVVLEPAGTRQVRGTARITWMSLSDEYVAPIMKPNK
jgi:hypothetical protein